MFDVPHQVEADDRGNARGRRAGRGRAGLAAVLAALVGLVTCAVGAPAARANPSARALVDEARAALARGEADEARGLYERALERDPNYRPALAEVVPLWFKAGAYPVAIAHLERATRRFPDYAFGWYSLAYAYRHSGRAAHAVLAYEAYIALRPGEAAPYFGLAVSYVQIGERDKARAAFERYVERETDPARAAYVEHARAQIAALSREAGGAADARPADAKPADAKPADTNLTDAKSSDAKLSGAKPSDTKPSDTKPSDTKPSDAKPAGATPPDAKPSSAKSPDATPVRAGDRSAGEPGAAWIDALVAAGRLASAEAALAHAGAALDPGIVSLVRARILLGRGQPRAALVQLSRALADRPGDPAVYRALSRAHRALGMPDLAAYFAREADHRAAPPE